MNDLLDLDDIFEMDGKDYLTVDKTNYNGSVYYFINELISENEPSTKFLIYKEENDGLVDETDEKIIGELFEIFSKSLNERIESIKSDISDN